MVALWSAAQSGKDCEDAVELCGRIVCPGKCLKSCADDGAREDDAPDQL